MKKLCILLIVFLFACSMPFLGACDNGGGEQPGGSTGGNTEQGGQPGGNEDDDGKDEEPAKDPIVLTLSESEITLDVSESAVIRATAKNTTRPVKWYSSNNLVVSLETGDNSVTVTGLDGGTAIITAYVGDVKAEASATVVEKEIEADYDLKVDGDLSDWDTAGLKAHNIAIKGTQTDDSYKSAVFYGVLDKSGLHLAVEAYHDIYVDSHTEFGEWWQNTQFEFFIGFDGADSKGTQYFVYACDGSFKTGKGSAETDEFDAKMVTVEQQGDGVAKYKTIVEVFVPMNKLPAASNATLRVGVAWKTPGDLITGGEAEAGGKSEYWVPAGCWSQNKDKPYVTESGIYLPKDYEGKAN